MGRTKNINVKIDAEIVIPIKGRFFEVPPTQAEYVIINSIITITI